MRQLLSKIWIGAVFATVAVSAQQTSHKFRNLVAADTISNTDYQRWFGVRDVRANFLVSKWKGGHETEKLALFKKQGESWLIFWLFEEQTTENVKLTEDEKYMTYVTSTKISGQGFSKSRFYFCIIDLDNQKQMPILQQYNDETWKIAQLQKSDPVSETGCSAQIVWLGKGNLTSVYTATKDFDPALAGDDCLPRGQYKIQNDKLVKIK